MLLFHHPRMGFTSHLHSFPAATCGDPFWTYPQSSWFNQPYPTMTDFVDDVHNISIQSDDSTVSSTSPDYRSSEQPSHIYESYYMPYESSITKESITSDDRSWIDFNNESNETFECKWKSCRCAFMTLNALSNHVAVNHANAEGGLFYCGWSGCSRGHKGFNARYKMLVHVRSHTNEKPHKCCQCEKSFSRAENLKIHIRSHSGEKPYTCPVEGCNKAYSNSSDRFKHTKTHSVDKPYCCKVPGCQKRYTDPSSLRKHVKTFKHANSTKSSNQPEMIQVDHSFESNDNRQQLINEDNNYVSKYDLNTTKVVNRSPSPVYYQMENVRMYDSNTEVNFYNADDQKTNQTVKIDEEYKNIEEPLNLKRYSDDNVYENGVLNLQKKFKTETHESLYRTLLDLDSPLDLSIRKINC